MALAAPAMEDASCRRRKDLLMVKIGKVADWLGIGAPLLDAEITDVASIENAGPGS